MMVAEFMGLASVTVYGYGRQLYGTLRALIPVDTVRLGDGSGYRTNPYAGWRGG